MAISSVKYSGTVASWVHQQDKKIHCDVGVNWSFGLETLNLLGFTESCQWQIQRVPLPPLLLSNFS